MEKGGPPSPAPSHTLNHADEALRSDLEQLIQHNAATAAYAHIEGSHMGSNPHSRYSSPGPQAHMIAGYDHHTPINHGSPFAAPPYSGYQTAYGLDPSPYPQLPDVGSSATSHNAYSTPATSPPTPVQAEGITTRSGRSIARPSAAHPVARPPRADKPPPKARSKKRKRGANGEGAENATIALAEPLSQLVRDITDIVDTDIQAYVNRSPEDRRREVDQSKNGKVKRPMNAFMLYRKAYQNRTKEWKRLDDIRRKEASAGEGKPEKGHDNHQVISQVCGLSWNMEPQELRDQYDEWAKIERENHKKAFPDYKFAPAKSKVRKTAAGSHVGSRRGDRDSDDDNASNLDAYDFQDWGHPGSGPPSRNAMRSSRYVDPEAEYVLPPGYPPSMYASPSPGMQAARLPPGYGAQTQPHIHQPPHPSSFQYSNPGKPRPADYGAALGHGQYYQQNTELAQQSYPHQYGATTYGIHHHHQGIPSFVENVFINKTNSPSSFQNPPILDQQAYNELMAQSASYASHIPHPHTAVPHPHPYPHTQHHHPHQHMPRHTAEHQIDPSLTATRHEPGGAGGGGAGNSTIVHSSAYDALGILGLGQGEDFGADSLPSYHLDQGSGLGGNQVDSPHPQQFEQAYHTPNDTSVMTGGEGGGDAAPPAGELSWQDGGDGAADVKLGTSDWETTLAGAAEFQLEDIDQILGTTTDSPAG
ncbi:hypothetical protein F4802DRAFT_615127 [Xylaria palmicola]|nr:hypothetical protein F4802DRAFT_615127 [Xylaria palmicola]